MSLDSFLPLGVPWPFTKNSYDHQQYEDSMFPETFIACACFPNVPVFNENPNMRAVAKGQFYEHS